MLGIKEGDRNHDFPAQLVRLNIPKHFAGEAFSV